MLVYDGSCLLMSDRENGPKGVYREPNPELSFEKLAQSLLARIIALKKI
jgi:hypothetical protein